MERMRIIKTFYTMKTFYATVNSSDSKTTVSKGSNRTLVSSVVTITTGIEIIAEMVNGSPLLRVYEIDTRGKSRRLVHTLIAKP